MNIGLMATVLIAQVGAADTLVVRTTGESWSLNPREVSRIGSIDGPPETSFGSVSTVLGTADGTTFVADDQVPVVRVFSPDGEYLHDIGRKGQGPGEYEGIFGVALSPDREVVVWDYNTRRVSYFRSDGTFERSFPTELKGVSYGRGSLLVGQDGTVRLLTPADPSMYEQSSRPREAVIGWMQYRPDGSVTDSLIPPRREVSGSYNAFKVETASAVAPDGTLVSGRNSEYALHRQLGDGRVVRIERPYEPVELERDERHQWATHQVEWERRWAFESPEIPETKPAWRELIVDASGRIWVHRYSAALHRPGYSTPSAERGGWTAVEWVEPVVFDLLDPRGQYLGSISLDDRTEFAYSVGNWLWVIERGEFDEAYVVRYAIEPRSGAD